MAKEKTAKQPKPVKRKPSKGRMPTKRSINLMIVNEHKIDLMKAIPAILAIVVLAALFSKFLVIDRMNEVNTITGRVDAMKANLDKARASLESYGDIETTYAHYTQEDMTPDETSMVGRSQVLALVRSLLSEGNATFGSADFREKFDESYAVALEFGAEDFDAWKTLEDIREFVSSRREDTTVYTWSVSGNTLTVDITGKTLEKLNKVARRLETSPIVDSVTISTANKQANGLNGQNVSAKLIIYLIQPSEEASQS